MSRSAVQDVISGLPDDYRAALNATARPVTLTPDQVLFLAGDPGDGCFRVEEGLVKVSLVSANGIERILAVLGQGAIIGELAILDGQPRSATVTALRATKLTFFPRAAFQALADENPDIYRHLTRLLASRLRETNASIASVTFLGLDGRIARILIDLAEAFGKDVGQGRILIHQKVTQGDVAAMAGMARENASRILNRFIRDQQISRLSGYYCIEKKRELQQLAAL
jgi:CRP/FNR family transcriptional regulator, cyclic AMP receptor protein